MGRRGLFLISTFLLLIACSPSATIKSNLREGYNKKLTSVYMIGRASTSGSPVFINAVFENLKQLLSGYSIDTELHIYDPLGLDEDSIINEEIKSFHPFAVLSMVQTGQVNSMGGGGMKGGSFELSLVEPGEKAPFWKAVLETQKPQSSFSVGPVIRNIGDEKDIGDAKMTAEKIILKFFQDGLITNNSGTKETP